MPEKLGKVVANRLEEFVTNQNQNSTEYIIVLISHDNKM